VCFGFWKRWSSPSEHADFNESLWLDDFASFGDESSIECGMVVSLLSSDITTSLFRLLSML
jgi:hypothetical protein